MTLAARIPIALLVLVLGGHAWAAGSGSEPSDAPPSTSGRNLLMGTGELRDPQPFTREHRLLYAVREGDLGTVERALELGESVHARDDLGRSALLLAVRDAGSLELTHLLHERGARVDEADASGRTPLSYAAAKGRLALVEFLLEEGAAVDRPDDQGRTPLYHAALGNQPEVIERLHRSGADLDARTRKRATPLIAACEKDAAAAADRLLELGADPSLVDRWGRGPADRAVAGTPLCLELAPKP